MQLVHQYCNWIQPPPANTLALLERIGRVAYKSEDRITNTSAEPFVRGILARGHESVIEHVSASVLFVTDRGVTHELVRHRLCAFTQESTRFCNYGKLGEVTFVEPIWWPEMHLTPAPLDNPSDTDIVFDDNSQAWLTAMQDAEDIYLDMLKKGWSPQQARTVLPNSLKTEIVVTANLREWRHIFRLRCAKAAHPQMRALMLQCLAMFNRDLPVLFEDLAAEHLPKQDTQNTNPKDLS